jgi:hypothetical protein
MKLSVLRQSLWLDLLLHQGNIEPVPNFHPSADSGLYFFFQWVVRLSVLGFMSLDRQDFLMTSCDSFIK